MKRLSKWLRSRPEASSADAINRIRIAMARLPNVLERQTVACQKTLEQKISDQGPGHLRVHPHLLGLAIRELLKERNTITAYTHPATGHTKWFANASTSSTAVTTQLDTLAPLYKTVSTGTFLNLVGDALEIITFKTLQTLSDNSPRFSFLGSFDLDAPKTSGGRFRKTEPPNTVSGHTSAGRPDFILFGFDAGPISIECKNYREWLYPHHELIIDLITVALKLKTTPLLIARRLHYTTITNFLEPAGILAHETYYQYYPSDHAELADQARHKRSLGFSDIRATEDPHPRTLKFFLDNLPKVADRAAERFLRNTSALSNYVSDEINLAQFYTAIGSPAGGKWVDFEKLGPDE